MTRRIITAGSAATAAGTPAPQPAVHVEQAQLTLGGRAVLRGIDLSVGSGRICGLLGPNGAGKSSTIRLLLGLWRADAGRVSVLGSDDPVSIRHRIGYLPEERGLYKRMRVTDFLRFMGRLRGLGGALLRQRVAAAVSDFGLDAHARKHCEALSKGLGQRVQLAATLIHDPELLILDEPFSGLDPRASGALIERLRACRDAGATLLLATHQLDLAEQICDDVVLVDHGRSVLAGTPAALCRGAPARIRLTHGPAPLPALPPGCDVLQATGDSLELGLAGTDLLPGVLRTLVGALAVRSLEVRQSTLGDVIRERLDSTADAPRHAASESTT